MSPAFLSVSDLAVAQAVGANIKDRTFINAPDLPFAWYCELRRMGFTPVAPAPSVQQPKEAEAERAYAREIGTMTQARYNALREAGWVPGDPILPETDKAA